MNRILLNSNQNWPEDYGFWIYGTGPTYVIYVEPDSVAAKSGIKPGDKIIEIDQKNVSDHSSDEIKTKVRASSNNPPFVSVQSALRQTQVVSRQDYGQKSFGFSYSGTLPVVVDEVEFNESSYLSGLRNGDIILFANNIPIKDSYSLKKILELNRVVDLKYIRVNQDSVRNFSVRSNSEQDSLSNLYEAVNRYFRHDKMKRDFLLREIAKYNQFGDIESLSSSLGTVLISPYERSFISLLKSFMPPSHYQRLEILNRSDYKFRKIDSLEYKDKIKRRNSRKKYKKSSESSEDSEEFEDKSTSSTLDKNDRRTLKKIISSYNKSKNFEKLYQNVAKMSQTRPKPELWEQICPLLDCEHRLCLKDRLMRKSCPKIDTIACCSPQKTIRRQKVCFIDPCEPMHCEPKVFKSKIYASAPSLDCFAKEKFPCLMDQLKCHLNSHECVCVKKALCDYDRNKNFCELLYKVNKVFNTASKRSLWPKLVCYLDEPDQDYFALSRKLNQNRNNLTNCSFSKKSLKNPKHSANTLVFRERKPRSKSLFRWEPDSEEENEWKNERPLQKLNFAHTTVSDHEYFVYDTDTEIFESEEHNIEFEIDKATNNIAKKLVFDNSRNNPIYSKSFSNFNKISL